MDDKAKIALAALSLVAAALVWVVFGNRLTPRAELKPDDLPLKFLGYQAQGTTEVAAFEIRNETESRVVVWEPARLIQDDHTAGGTQESTISRTLVPAGATAVFTVAPPEESAWRLEVGVARFGPAEERAFDAGETVKGTVLISEEVPGLKPKD